MKHVNVSDTYGFALVGHSGDGNTSLGEALLHAAGPTQPLGRVDDGSSTLNHLPEEKERRTTITSSVYGFDAGGRHLTLVDTPGDSNFQADGQIALHALDGAVLVCSAVGGVKVGTSRMWHACERLSVPAWSARLRAATSTCSAALFVSPEVSVTPVMLSTTRAVPVAAAWTFCEISPVAERCCSIAAATAAA